MISEPLGEVRGAPRRVGARSLLGDVINDGERFTAASPASRSGEGCGKELPKPGDTEILVLFTDAPKTALGEDVWITFARVGVNEGRINAYPAMQWSAPSPYMNFDGVPAEEFAADLETAALSFDSDG